MKKVLLFLLMIFLLVSCYKKPDFNNDFKLETYQCDMSDYEGLDSFNHHFKGITVKELERVFIEKGYGCFILSRSNCDHCQMIMQYLEEVLTELDIEMYYIDAYSSTYPILGTQDYDLLALLLYDCFNEGDNSTGDVQTPLVFTIIDGQIISSKIGTTWSGLNYDEEDVAELKALYKQMLKPFAR